MPTKRPEMVVGAFPIAKLAALAFRQLSKPLANRIKAGAKKSPFFRTYVCMPPAQIYHWIEVNVKMRILNLGRPTDVPKLNEAMAIELGSELLGEVIIFTSAAATLVAEYVRQARNERLKEQAKEDKHCCLEREVEELRFLAEMHEAQIRHLSRLVGDKSGGPPVGLPTTRSATTSTVEAGKVAEVAATRGATRGLAPHPVAGDPSATHTHSCECDAVDGDRSKTTPNGTVVRAVDEATSTLLGARASKS
ncbi:conserved hypothetical protein [Ixodes scapularis]|uniref:Optic atrophy 3 protein homolog n=1 Tax=Ixodes scapularis TaxID=6945 RepID=B7P6X4_IXOSC|nr:conserved hypothetical protein [Ixodes scapularis]|eukprot:XP_002409351.1 conserved hypothetical protein [Ixodes scapularis]